MLNAPGCMQAAPYADSPSQHQGHAVKMEKLHQEAVRAVAAGSDLHAFLALHALSQQEQQQHREAALREALQLRYGLVGGRGGLEPEDLELLEAATARALTMVSLFG